MRITPFLRMTVLTALCGLAGWYMVVALQAVWREAPEVTLTEQPTSGAADQEEPPTIQWAGDAFDELRRRPLFNASRRPVPPPTPAAAAPPPAPAPPAPRPPPALLQLIVVGVAIEPGRRVVLVRPAPGGAVSMLQEGQTLEGWRLEQIETNAAIFRNGSAEMQVSLPRPEAKRQTADPTVRTRPGR
jgi:hypothetical protein